MVAHGYASNTNTTHNRCIIKKGFPTNIMAGMQVRIPPSSSANGIEWYNYGLHSQPLAYRWTNIPMIYETNFKVQLYLGNMKQEEEEEQQPVESINNKNNKNSIKWISLERHKRIMENEKKSV